MMKIYDGTMKAKSPFINFDSYYIKSETFNSYYDVTSDSLYSRRRRDNSKQDNIMIFMSLEPAGTTEVFDETDGGFW